MNALTIPSPHPLYFQMLETVRSLSEGRILRDPEAKLITRIKKENHITPIAIRQHVIKPSYDGQAFIHFVSGQKVTVLKRNIYGKLLIKWPDGNITVLGDHEFEIAFAPEE